jgi:hypothetical protein
MPITVASLLPADFDVDGDEKVLVVVGQDETKVALPFARTREISEFIGGLVPEDGSERVIPVDQPFADKETLTLLATWMAHYESAPLPTLHMPVPIVAEPRILFNDWDAEFLGTVVCGGDFSTAGVPRLYRLGRLACFLAIKPLMRLVLTLIAHFITVGTRESGKPTEMVRGWFGKTGDYEKEEAEGMISWMADACRGMRLSKRDPAAMQPGKQ